MDAIAFGLAPVVVLATLPDRPSGALAVWWWISGAMYAIAAVTRLGCAAAMVAPLVIPRPRGLALGR